jgi:hypothetical protein
VSLGCRDIFTHRLVDGSDDGAGHVWGANNLTGVRRRACSDVTRAGAAMIPTPQTDNRHSSANEPVSTRILDAATS